jgi:hypothetical protein
MSAALKTTELDAEPSAIIAPRSARAGLTSFKPRPRTHGAPFYMSIAETGRVTGEGGPYIAEVFRRPW